MTLVISGLVILLLVIVGFVVRSRMRRRKAEQHSISVDALLQLKEDGGDFLLFDVRLPLDLLAHSEIIPVTFERGGGPGECNLERERHRYPWNVSGQ